MCQFIEISNQMATSQTLKRYFLCNMVLYKKIVQGLKLCHLTPFDWKFLRIGTLRAKDLRKNVLILQKGGFTPVPLTLLAIRVVLLQKQAIVQRFLSLTVCSISYWQFDIHNMYLFSW